MKNLKRTRRMNELRSYGNVTSEFEVILGSVQYRKCTVVILESGIKIYVPGFDSIERKDFNEYLVKLKLAERASCMEDFHTLINEENEDRAYSGLKPLL